MFDALMQLLRQRQGQGGLPPISSQQGPYMRNAGQSMGEFSDAIAAQPGNMMRGGDLWTRQGGGGMLGGGAQTFPASPPPQFNAMPMGVPQNAMPGLGGLLGMYGQQPSTAIPDTQAMFQGIRGAPPAPPAATQSPMGGGMNPAQVQEAWRTAGMPSDFGYIDAFGQYQVPYQYRR